MDPDGGVCLALGLLQSSVVFTHQGPTYLLSR